MTRQAACNGGRHGELHVLCLHTHKWPSLTAGRRAPAVIYSKPFGTHCVPSCCLRSPRRRSRRLTRLRQRVRARGAAPHPAALTPREQHGPADCITLANEPWTAGLITLIDISFNCRSWMHRCGGGRVSPRDRQGGRGDETSRRSRRCGELVTIVTLTTGTNQPVPVPLT